MKRNFIKDILNMNLHEKAFIKGWIIKKDKKIYLQDITGEIKLTSDLSMNVNDRDVVYICGEIEVNDSDKVLYVHEMSILNASERQVNLLYTEEDFLKKSYQYYHDTSKISFLKKINKLQVCVRDFLYENLFVELNNPLLWASVQEYGKRELKVINPIDKRVYFLPQSPNQQNLISVIGGIERNFQFNHCFRIQDQTDRNDSVCEFTQLAITEAFTNSKEGMLIVEKLIKKMLIEIGVKESVIFETISYENCLKLYGDDKPDFRYKEFYTPVITMKSQEGKDEEYVCLYIPYDVDCMFIKKISKLLQSRIKYIFLKKQEDGTLKKIAGNMISEGFKDINKFGLDCSMQKYILIVKGHEQYHKDLIRSIQLSICKKIKKKLPIYAMVWVTGYPYIDISKNNDNMHDNIGQNIFTKIEDSYYDAEEIDYKNCKTCGVDLVINGIEIASGGEKENNLKRFLANVKMLNIEDYQNKYDFYIEALKEGAPPFFSIGIGWERLLYVLLKPKYFSELFIFPKSITGDCLLTKK